MTFNLFQYLHDKWQEIVFDNKEFIYKQTVASSRPIFSSHGFLHYVILSISDHTVEVGKGFVAFKTLTFCPICLLASFTSQLMDSPKSKILVSKYLAGLQRGLIFFVPYGLNFALVPSVKSTEKIIQSGRVTHVLNIAKLLKRRL